MASYSQFTNPFARTSFFGREKELNIIWGRLLNESLQSIAIIGEPYIGKTSLVKHLMGYPQPIIDEKGVEHYFKFIYLDCKRYIELMDDWKTKAQRDEEIMPLGLVPGLNRQRSSV